MCNPVFYFDRYSVDQIFFPDFFSFKLPFLEYKECHASSTTFVMLVKRLFMFTLLLRCFITCNETMKASFCPPSRDNGEGKLYHLL